MDDIKFRFRLQSKIDGKIITKFISLLSLSGGLIYNPIDTNEWEILSCDRFTGFKDRNGKEIYENDVLGNGKVEQDVYWSKKTARFCCNSKSTKGWSLSGMATILEIVRNVYEK